jgi:AraC-like DNA-binding protein
MPSRRARPELAAFVERLWYHEGEYAHAREVVLPSGRMQLLFDLSGGRPMMTGVSTRPTTVETSTMARVVGVLFRPGGAWPFVPAPCIVLRDLAVGLDDLGQRSTADELADRVRASRSPGAMLDAVEAALLRRAVPVDPDQAMIARAVAWLARGVPVAAVIRRTGASRSRFVRLLQARVGINPKQVAGLARFQRAVGCLAAGRVDLASVAAECGYFDQAHMSHEFRRYAGRPPSAYRPRDPLDPNHLLE